MTSGTPNQTEKGEGDTEAKEGSKARIGKARSRFAVGANTERMRTGANSRAGTGGKLEKGLVLWVAEIWSVRNQKLD